MESLAAQRRIELCQLVLEQPKIISTSSLINKANDILGNRGQVVPGWVNHFRVRHRLRRCDAEQALEALRKAKVPRKKKIKSTQDDQADAASDEGKASPDRSTSEYVDDEEDEVSSEEEGRSQERASSKTRDFKCQQPAKTPRKKVTPWVITQLLSNLGSSLQAWDDNKNQELKKMQQAADKWTVALAEQNQELELQNQALNRQNCKLAKINKGLTEKNQALSEQVNAFQGETTELRDQVAKLHQDVNEKFRAMVKLVKTKGNAAKTKDSAGSSKSIPTPTIISPSHPPTPPRHKAKLKRTRQATASDDDFEEEKNPPPPPKLAKTKRPAYDSSDEDLVPAPVVKKAYQAGKLTVSTASSKRE
jgi:hypothetical protein